jgi:Response regulators consisting of a CheY-like receiver domain and a winged-helix DNA-binding domain
MTRGTRKPLPGDALARVTGLANETPEGEQSPVAATGESNGSARSGAARTPPHLLLVEDNPGDAFLLQQALKEAGFPYTMTVASDGDQALRSLSGATDRKIPDLVLLDLNLPGKSGHEILREIKQNSSTRRIPVIVLSSSEAESDLALAYDLHANCYVHKPIGLNEMFRVAEQIALFWFNAVSLPRQREASLEGWRSGQPADATELATKQG